MDTYIWGIVIAAFVLGVLVGAFACAAMVCIVNQKKRTERARRRKAQQKSGYTQNRSGKASVDRVRTDARSHSKTSVVKAQFKKLCHKLSGVLKNLWEQIRAISLKQEMGRPKSEKNTAQRKLPVDSAAFETPIVSSPVKSTATAERTKPSGVICMSDAAHTEKQESTVTLVSEKKEQHLAEPPVRKEDFSAFTIGLRAEFDWMLSSNIYLHEGQGYRWNPMTDEAVPDENARKGYYTLQNLARNGLLRLFDVRIEDRVISYSMYEENEELRKDAGYYQIESVQKTARVKKGSQALDHYSLESPGLLVLHSI